GVTMDQQRLRVADVSLTLQSSEGGLKRALVSGADGSFVFTALTPGEYKLNAQTPGFQPTEVRITLEVNQNATVAVVLPVASQSETIHVTEAMPLLHPNEAAVGQVVDKEQVAELPLNGRQFMDLTT